MICNYCGKYATWCENKEIYGKNYGRSYMIWYCKDCNAYVGCHNNSRKAKGSLANEELRAWRMVAHEEFDKLWKGKKRGRNKAYEIMAKHFGEEVHIGWSGVERCKQIIEFAHEYLENCDIQTRMNERIKLEKEALLS